MTQTQEALEQMTVKELRQTARATLGGKVWIANATKDKLITSILAGEEVAEAETTGLFEIPERKEETPMATPKNLDVAQAFSTLASALTGRIDTEEIKNMVREEVAKLAPREVIIKVERPDGTYVIEGRQHKQFKLLMTALSCRVNCWLAGEAGSGKTTAAEKAAEALGLDFYCQSFGLQTSQSNLLGYMNATGDYVHTDFRRAYENGGVYLLDEVDNANPQILTVLNSATANSYCSFADKMVKKHSDFVLIAGANTFGTGGSRQYIRNQIDGATLDRFFFIHWELDEGLEASMLGIDELHEPLKLDLGGIPKSANEWLSVVRAYRQAVAQAGLRHIVSPRASAIGYKLAQAGIGGTHLLNGLIYKGMDETSRKKIDELAGDILKEAA